MTVDVPTHARTVGLRLTIAAVLGCLTLIAYWRAMSFGFIDLDDHHYITEVPQVLGGLTSEGILWPLTTDHVANWHPLTTWSYMLDVELFGVSPQAMHRVNVALHLANALLLFALLDRLTGALWRSAFVAAMFALHPLHVESVAWISERKDVLSTLLALLTIAAYARYARKPQLTWYLLVVIALALGLMAKAMLVTMPFILLLLDFWPLRRWAGLPADANCPDVGATPPRRTVRQLVIEKLPLLALALASAVVTFVFQRAYGTTAALEEYPIADRLANAALNYFRYIHKTIWPIDLALLYPVVSSRRFVSVLAAATGIVALSMAALCGWRRRPYLTLGWFWYLGTLVPVIGLVQVGEQSIADRYTYFPLIGLTVAATWAVADRWGAWRIPRGALAVVGVVVVVACTVRTRVQAAFWRDSESIFARTLEVEPDNPVILHSLGRIFAKQGRVEQAIPLLRNAAELDPGRSGAWGDLGLSLASNGQRDEALACLHKSAALEPRSSDGHYTLAAGYLACGDDARAAQHADAALNLEPGHPLTHYLLGFLSIRSGRLEEAVAHFTKGIQSNQQLDSRYRLAVVQSRLGRTSHAVEQFRAVLAVDPAHGGAHYGLGMALVEQGDLTDAAAHLAEAARSRTHARDARLALARLAARAGQSADALTWLNQVLAESPDDAAAHFQVGLLAQGSGQVESAVAHYRKALEHNPASSARNNLAWLLATSDEERHRNGGEAVLLAEALRSGETRPDTLDTLAAAYAEAGRFDDAVRTAREALALAEKAGQGELATQLRGRLALYESGKPYREPSVSTQPASGGDGKS
ncbi:MAG: tetratricopeptide repeat protein [Tepidisphaeraceae bacterium]